MPEEEAYPLLDLLQKMKQELRNPIADSYHLIVAYLYQFLLLFNRIYASRFHLPFALPLNNYAYQYKQLLEKNICDKARVADYAEMMGISRVSLNKAVMREFGLSAVHLLNQSLRQGNRFPPALLRAEPPDALLQADDGADHQRVSCGDESWQNPKTEKTCRFDKEPCTLKPASHKWRICIAAPSANRLNPCLS